MTLNEALTTHSYILLDREGILRSPNRVTLLKVKPVTYQALESKVGGKAKIGNLEIHISVDPNVPTELRLSTKEIPTTPLSIDLKKLLSTHGSIEIDSYTGEIKTLTEVSVGTLDTQLLSTLSGSNGKVQINGETLYITKENNRNLILKRSHDELVTLEDIMKFGIDKGVTNISITSEASRYRLNGKLYAFEKMYTEKDIAKLLDMYDKGILINLEHGAYTTTKTLSRTVIHIHVVKDNRYTVVLDFVPSKDHTVDDFFNREWLQFINSRNKTEQGGIVILSEKQDLPEIIPLFIGETCTPDNVVMCYGKSYSSLDVQHLEFSRSVPLSTLTRINTDILVLDFSVALNSWDSVYEMIDNGTVVVITVNESSLYLTLNMIIETFTKQYQYRKFIDTLLGMNIVSTQHQHDGKDLKIKYDYIYNNKQFQILLGSKVYTKQDLEDKKYKHYFLTIGGSHKSIEDTLRDILVHANEIGAHDISLSAGSPPAFRKGREMIFDFTEDKLLPYMTESIFLEIVKDPNLQEQFRQNPGAGLAISYSVPGLGRYRVNIYSQRGSVALSLRRIPSDIPSMEWCGIPKRVQEVIRTAKTGIILVTGPTGSGKSTTLASIIDFYNMTRASKIITTEDPIEYLHNRKRSLIEQIEVGQDTNDYVSTLKSNMRNNPDILLIGEIRDSEVLSVALNAAVTGHLVLATMHTSGAVETIQRALDMTPIEGRENIKSLLSQNIICTLTQQLIPRIGGGMVAVHEVMIPNPAIRTAISDGNPKSLGTIPNQLRSGRDVGMQDMDYSIATQVIAGNTSIEDAETYAPSIDSVKRYVASATSR